MGTKPVLLSDWSQTQMENWKKKKRWKDVYKHKKYAKNDNDCFWFCRYYVFHLHNCCPCLQFWIAFFHKFPGEVTGETTTADTSTA